MNKPSSSKKAGNANEKKERGKEEKTVGVMNKLLSFKKAGNSSEKKERGKEEKLDRKLNKLLSIDKDGRINRKKKCEEDENVDVRLTSDHLLFLNLSIVESRKHLEELEKKSEKGKGCAKRLLPEDETEQKEILRVLKALMEQCIEEGGPFWEIDDGIRFVYKVKVTYQTDSRPYVLFLHFMEKFKRKEKTLTYVVEAVAILFKNHPDLIQNFKSLLPDSVKDLLPSPPPCDQAVLLYTRSLDFTLKNLLSKKEYKRALKLIDDGESRRITEEEAMHDLEEIFLRNKQMRKFLHSMIYNLY